MSFRKVFCPECGQQTHVNDRKEFSFCQECGSKIMLQPKKVVLVQQTAQTARKENMATVAMPSGNLEKKLEEAEFYYQLSKEKNEATRLNEDPIYFLKAQDILSALSSQYPQDYRVWWELCKPVDYAAPEMSVDTDNRHSINEAYFEKALDAADIATKRELINLHDQYLTQKKHRLEEYARQKREAAAAEQAAAERHRQEELVAAEKRHQEELKEAEIRRQEELRLQEQEAARVQEQRQQQQELQNKIMADSVPLWERLACKTYDDLDGKHFILPQANNQSVIGVFRNVSNMLYLLAYRMDHTKGNLVYHEQNMTVKFDGNGFVLKYDNTPVKVQCSNAVVVLRIMSNGNGGISVCNVPLMKDASYIKNIMQVAKKPLLTKKIFM